MKKVSIYLLFALLLLSAGGAFAQTVSYTLTQAPCNNNGILTVNLSGFTTPMTVTWHFGGTPVVHSGVTGSTDVLNNYSGAPGYVLVVDANNNTGSASYNGAPPFNFSVTTTPAICPALGSASVSVTGGSSPYSYVWTNRSTSAVVGTASTANNLPAGEYDVTITDNNGCVYGTKVFDSSKAVVYSQSNIAFNVSTTPANCTNGTATVGTVTGGVAPYSYLWSNSATTSSITGLIMGGYTVKVTDAQGCSSQRYTYVQQSKQIGTNVVAKPATCTQNDGSLTSFGSGGVPPYSYLWSTGATTPSINGLPVGYYSVTVTDANGCIGNGGLYVSASTPIKATVSTVPSACTTANGSATLSISGGATPYNIHWYTSPVQTATTALNLSAGTHSFKITDANGCVRTGTANVPPVNQLIANLTVANATCTQSNGSVASSVSGGTSPYTYTWTNSATTSSISGLSAGSYGVTIKDNIGCEVKKYASVKVNSPVNVGLSTTPASCLFNSDGSITATAWGGATPYQYSWSNGNNTATNSSLKRGYYYVNVTDANGCKAHTYTYLGYNPNNNSCYCTITGTVYDDANSNCTKDVGEAGIPNIRVHCSGVGYAFTDANGVYSFKVPSGSYTITETVLGYYPLASCQSNGVNVTVTASTNCTHTVNFANTINPIHDMHISTWNFTCPVPGYQYKQKCVITNMGTVTEANINASYNTDGQLSTPTFLPSGKFSGSGNHYTITGSSLSLAPGNSQPFMAYYNVPSNIPLNTSLVFTDTVAHTAPLSNWVNDYSPWNNVNYYKPVTVGSYDPNFKEVSPKGNGPKGIITRKDSVLEYMIHFQNIGTYKAQNIYILDTLDKNLDWSTLRPVYKSHPCNVTMGENGVVRFQFDNINLPYETYDPEGSNGMVTYTIHTKPGLAIGTEFKNTAAIYFDYNEPVITNTTLNTLGELSVEGLTRSDDNAVTIYPNPARNAFTVRIDKGEYSSVKVMNTMGQVVAQRYIDGKETTVNLGTTAPGVYFVVLSGTDGMKVEKIEKL